MSKHKAILCYSLLVVIVALVILSIGFYAGINSGEALGHMRYHSAYMRPIQIQISEISSHSSSGNLELNEEIINELEFLILSSGNKKEFILAHQKLKSLISKNLKK